ncbi:MAG: HD domain-containing protein [Coriobacteriia bacterium]|nr:HD domain-containing protein [Coriobacteriia bacterium]
MSAEHLVAAVSGSRRAVQLYPPAHPSHVESISSLVQAVTELTCDGSFVLNLHEGRLYSGSDVLSGDSPAAASLSETMERHHIESLTFEPGFTPTDAVALADVLNLRPSAELDVESELGARGAMFIIVAALKVGDEERVEREERDRRRQQDRALYRQLITALRGIDQGASSGASPDLENASRMVGDIMSRMVEDESAVLGMAMMNSKDDSSLFHSVNVMIYALTLGLGLGLPDEGLMSLGMAAMLHDIGKAAFDASDPEQARAAQALHPKVGAEILARIADADRTPMLVAYEHHMGIDGSGYPDRPAEYVGHPYSRMVAIADRYEHLTKGDAGVALSPDRGVMQILREAGKSLDPFFARLFVRALGVFPVGCVVRLSDMSIAVVRAKGEDLLAPSVSVVYGPDGEEFERPVDVDLADDGRTIVEVVDADTLRLNVADKI